MTVAVMPTSGQRRVDAKRTQRGEYWRTVRISVSADYEPYFRQHLGHLGRGTRIVSARPSWYGMSWDMDVHIPGAPAKAARADLVWWSEYDGHGRHSLRPHSVDYFDASGYRIETAEQLAEVAS